VTASIYFHVQLRCNGDDCRARFGGNPMEPRKRVRNRARRQGWVQVKSQIDRDHDYDYCPACKNDIPMETL
jgi:hypothetical protein